MTTKEALRIIYDLRCLALEGMERPDNYGWRVAKVACEKQKRLADEALAVIEKALSEPPAPRFEIEMPCPNCGVGSVKVLTEKLGTVLAPKAGPKDEVDQLRVQLAGCGVAALGWNQNPAKVGDYGWSQSYQDVLELRRKYETLLRDWKAGPRKVSREWIDEFFDGQLVDTAVSMLRELGISVEGEKP